METIKNYLETMFMNLPNTPEVRRAKDELGQMMEDKFAELTEEGKTENEAVGTVISEFGNLNELADVLGINGYVNPQAASQTNASQAGGMNQNEAANANGANATGNANGAYANNAQAGQYTPHMLTSAEVKDYLKDKSREAFMIAFGVLLCIICVTGPIVTDAIRGGSDATGVLFMFLCIGIGVSMFVFSGIKMSKWNYIKQTQCAVDFATFNDVKQEKDRFNNQHAVFVTIGVLLCCICFVPAAVIDDMNLSFAAVDMGSITGAMLFWMVGAGVFLIVFSSIKMGSFQTILQTNDASTMGGNFTPVKEHQTYSNKTVEAIMSVYWSTVTCIYLIWSFLSFDWDITWIVWPVAAIVQVIVNNIFGED